MLTPIRTFNLRHRSMNFAGAPREGQIYLDSGRRPFLVSAITAIRFFSERTEVEFQAVALPGRMKGGKR